MRVSEAIGKEVYLSSLNPGDGFLVDGELYILTDGKMLIRGANEHIAFNLNRSKSARFEKDKMVIPVDTEVKWRFK